MLSYMKGFRRSLDTSHEAVTTVPSACGRSTRGWRRPSGGLMPSPEVLDFTRLLAPIPGEKATGVDLRGDSSPSSLYYKIRGARTAARGAERQLASLESATEEEKKRFVPPDWRPVLDSGVEALSKSSKDLEITAYLIESLVRLHDFPGLRDGFRLARELIERHWDDLYPLPDEDGLETRVAAITGLNGDQAEGTLILPLQMIPITEDTEVGPLTFAHYHEAQSLARLGDAKVREKKIASGAISMDKLQAAIAGTSSKFYITLVEDLQECAAEFAKLGDALTAKCGDAAPPSSSIRSALDSALDVIKDLARAKLPAASASAVPKTDDAKKVTESAEGSSPQANGAISVDAIIRNRDEALGQLLKVAEYFRRTEPHSVVSYALEQAVSWGRMSLPELLTELLEEAPRKNLFKFVGIKPPESAKPEPAKK
jgi:type VI secretion system protein ImpA